MLDWYRGEEREKCNVCVLALMRKYVDSGKSYEKTVDVLKEC